MAGQAGECETVGADFRKDKTAEIPEFLSPLEIACRVVDLGQFKHGREAVAPRGKLIRSRQTGSRKFKGR
ncbi:hypothetical protein D3C86_2007760 [compost metagenome]